MKSPEIRSKFLSFFESKAHQIVPSSPILVKNDPSLMFVNAGMVPFKDYFLGNKRPDNTRLCDSQKCLRVSGKHNDLEEVGYDTYHHTLFEMLGNWSFGDYFKKDAIAWAWELLTEVYGIDKEMLYVTVFEGSADDNLGKDETAYDIWKSFIPEARILNGNKKDNFWEMGEQGPCGPCSEIHVDIRPESEKAKIPGKALINKDHPLVIEIWNLVFMQYNRKADGSLEALPKTHIDTGMGFERLCMVLQGVTSSYDTDLFSPIIREIESITNTFYGKNHDTDVAIRVIADHIRAVAFAIADGQLPSNTGAGYVIRRILRRAVRYGFTFLNKKEPFIYRLIDPLSTKMSNAFPELNLQKQLIKNIIKEEEHAFLKTLSLGLSRLNAIIKERNSEVISGQKAFELYDTYGFPIDLTALILSEQKLTLNEDEFNQALQEQKKRSRVASESTADDWTVLIPNADTEFIGYDTLEAHQAQLVRYRKITLKKGAAMYQLVFNQTPFYPEGGGQVGDKGYLEDSHGNVSTVLNTKKETNLIVHFSKNLPKHLKQPFKIVVDKKQRHQTECNHTATHLLHQALREVLGSHVAQKGSAVQSNSLRFDFSHFSKVTPQELDAIETFINARIENNLPLVEKRHVSKKEAIAEGAMSLFGEKYGDTVRSIRFGSSVELCGGTHVKHTGDIWHFKIISESAVASGIRRIEAITSNAVKEFYAKNNHTLFKIKNLLNNTKDPVKTLQNIQNENNKLKKQIETLLRDKATRIKNEIKKELTDVDGVCFLAKKINLTADGLKHIAFELGQQHDNLFLVLATEQNGKALLSCYISKKLISTQGLDAGKIIKSLGTHIGGGGGGQAFFATAGGSNTEGIDAALNASKMFLKSL